jgi:hypothetical protein
MVNLLNRNHAVSSPVAAAPLTPADLHASGDPRRWTQLQCLRRQPQLETGPWLAAIEAGELALEADLVAVLADQLDGEGASRLLACWLRLEAPDPAIPPLLGHRRDPLWADRLRRHLGQVDLERRIPLLPLLGVQRDPADFPLLQALLLDPGPLPLRQAALEALGLGLSVWPRPALRQALAQLARDLQPALAREALDLLARLPGARSDLLRLSRHPLDPSLEPRLRRRLHALPAAPLLLLVHGRSGGHIPAELRALVAELEQRRGAPVRLLALTAPQPRCLPPADPLAPVATLVPLLLLPGGHVRQDLPRLTAELGRLFPVRRLPFLGSWPVWQRALAAELDALRAATNTPQTPLLLHHPLQGLLAERFLTLLARRCGAVCLPASFEDATSLPWVRQSVGALHPAVLPLALAANRLTDNLKALAPGMGAMPLLQRPRLRQVLLEALEALP